jgi:hypothetical protein
MQVEFQTVKFEALMKVDDLGKHRGCDCRECGREEARLCAVWRTASDARNNGPCQDFERSKRLVLYEVKV